MYDENYKSHGNVEILHSEKELADFLKNYPKTGVMITNPEMRQKESATYLTLSLY